MVRALFGGGVGDQVFGDIELGSRNLYGYVTDVNGDDAPVTLTAWSARTGGTQYTDLLDADSNPITEVVTTSGTGFVPEFYGPDGITTVYVRLDPDEPGFKFATGPAGPTGPAGAGDVVGPASSTADRLALFDGTTGKLLKQSATLDSAVVTLTGSQTLTNKTLTAPSISSPAVSGTPTGITAEHVGAASSKLGGAEFKTTASATTGSTTLDCSAASVFSVTPTGNITAVVLSNPPATGTACTITFIVNQGATPRTIATPTGGVFLGAATPTQVANKTCVFTYLTVDGGTTWYCSAAVQV